MSIKNHIDNIKPGSYIIVYNDENEVSHIRDKIIGKNNTGISDIVELRKDEKSIKITQVREIKKKLKLTTSSSINILIIYEAQDLTTEAANSLLKIIEEPPKKLVIVIFTDNYSKMLPTIKSRCKKIIIRSQLEIIEDNRYIKLLKSILKSKSISERFLLADKISKRKIDIPQMLKNWILFLEKDVVDNNMHKIVVINDYLKKYSKSLNKKLFLESLFLNI